MARTRSREVLQLALPIIGGMASQNLLNLADTWMVGGLGPDALAATGIANFVNFIAFAFIMGFASAVQAIAARRAGEGSTSELAVPLNGGLLLSLAIGVPMSAILIALTPQILGALTTDPDVVREGTPYLQWRLVAVAAVGMNFAFRGYWSAVKMTRLYLLTLVEMHALNVLFSYSLIYGHFGLPAMGTAGAGLGTTLATLAGTGIYFFLASRHARPHGFLRRRPTPEQFRSLVRLSIPSCIQQLLFSGGFLMLFWIVGKIGTPQLAVANVLINITLTAVLPAMGFGLAAATLCAQALGRGDPDDAQRWAWDTYRVALWVFAALSIPMLLLPGPILSFFLRDPALVELGRLPLQLVGATVALDGLGLIMMQALLGAGAAKLVMKVAVGLQWLLFLPLAWLLGPVLGHGLVALWLAMGGYRLLQALIFTLAWQERSWAAIRV
ncbi:MATE family efflux transporter [Solimonas fluminis]|uniref:Multidrug-efflux transporter n=1 Tax=Solimonas fluminis TaxID=2086571 RepID=A0A2S5TIP2_9GAMM|nr:MATE family efflux transporter [Solimonas fluminis]PPE74854.1 MATE family efflux transporter [Solimonas fluminis]